MNIIEFVTRGLKSCYSRAKLCVPFSHHWQGVKNTTLNESSNVKNATSNTSKTVVTMVAPTTTTVTTTMSPTSMAPTMAPTEVHVVIDVTNLSPDCHGRHVHKSEVARDK